MRDLSEVKTIFTNKETDLYKINTELSEDWHLVANRNIKKGEVFTSQNSSSLIDVKDLDFIDVILVETAEKKRVYSQVAAVPSNAECLHDTLEIPCCFMNHSCDANMFVEWPSSGVADLESAVAVAARDIDKGEMLTSNYNLEYFDYNSPFECSCSSSSCYGLVRGFNALDPEVKKTLLAKVSPFVQEKYRRELIKQSNSLTVRGRHLVIDYWECDIDLLNDKERLSQILHQAATAANAQVMSMQFHCFEPEGVTGFAILAESHISIHTWPKLAYAGVDIYTCGDCEPIEAHKVLEQSLSSSRLNLVELKRGGDSINFSRNTSDKGVLFSGLSKDESSYIEGGIPGCRSGNVNHGFKIDKLVHQERTKFQDCLIFDNSMFGRVLVLDGIVQLSTFDEYVYHEMLVQPVMFSHPNPQRLCIIGGGDGGTLRESLKHNPTEVVMIDIDEEFVRSTEKYLPSLSAGGFEDPRVTLRFEDASTALQNYKNTFDVVIIDCNSAVGPSEILFENEFYNTISQSLKEDGICAVQVGSTLDVKYVQQMNHRIAKYLGQISGFKFTMPSYHSGEYLFVTASKTRDPSGPDMKALEELQKNRGVETSYWSPAMHHASQVLAFSLL